MKTVIDDNMEILNDINKQVDLQNQNVIINQIMEILNLNPNKDITKDIMFEAVAKVSKTNLL